MYDCCKTCKKQKNSKCKVLLELGAWGPDCTAYTDDPNWEKEVKYQVEKYKIEREEREEGVRWSQFACSKT